MYAFSTVSAFLSGRGMQKVYPVNMQITVSAYLFPLEDGGWNSPIKSIDMSFIGAGSASKLYLLYFTACLLCS